MANKKLKTAKYVPGAGNRSRKRTGIVVQSIRMLASDNKLVRAAAKNAGESINAWVNAVLIREVNKALKRKRMTTEERMREATRG
jgi:hypothetical protein